MACRAVIFDLDGTLLDTLADVATSMNVALAQHGRPRHPHEAYRPWIGDGLRPLAERAVGQPTSPAEVDAVVEAYRAHYAEHMLDHTRLYDGIEALLDALTARGVPLGVLSNKPDPATQRVVRAMFPAEPFGAVVGHREGAPHKPAPESALAMCRALGAPPSEVALVGDTEIDVRTARAAGMRAWAATWGFRGPEELLRESPDALLTTPTDVLDLLP